MLDRIKDKMRHIPISAEAFGFAAVVASVAPVPDAAMSSVFNIRYLPLSHSFWSVLSSLAPIALFALAALAFCRSSWKIGAAGTVVALVSFIFCSSHGSTEPMVLLACTAICMLIFTVKTSVLDKQE